MIHVSISIEYKGIPFTIEIDTQQPELDVDMLEKMLVNMKIFIDKMLEAQRT
jgi:hypothetical protein